MLGSAWRVPELPGASSCCLIDPLASTPLDSLFFIYPSPQASIRPSVFFCSSPSLALASTPFLSHTLSLFLPLPRASRDCRLRCSEESKTLVLGAALGTRRLRHRRPTIASVTVTTTLNHNRPTSPGSTTAVLAVVVKSSSPSHLATPCAYHMPRLFSPFPGGQFASGCSSHHRPRNTQPAPLCLVRQGLQAPTADDDAAELQRRLSQFSRLPRAGIDKLDSASPPHLPGAATMCLTERSPRRLSSLPAVFSPPHPSSPTGVPKLPSYKRRSSSVGAMTSLIPLALASDDRRSPSLARRRQRLDSSSPSKPPLGRALPASPAEWKAVLEDVKRIYLADRHQECAARCHELLDLAAQVPVCLLPARPPFLRVADGTPEHQQHQQPVEPAYLVYLGLYAASALESQAQARPGGCQPPRPRVRRLALLQQAQAHHRAACLAAEPPSPVSRNCLPCPACAPRPAPTCRGLPSRPASPRPTRRWAGPMTALRPPSLPRSSPRSTFPSATPASGPTLLPSASTTGSPRALRRQSPSSSTRPICPLMTFLPTPPRPPAITTCSTSFARTCTSASPPWTSTSPRARRPTQNPST